MSEAKHTPGQRYEFEMSPAQLEKLLDAMKPVPYMVIGGVQPPSRQENANAAWARLGEELGFDAMSVQPTGRGDRFFSAVALQPTGEPKP